MWISRLPNTSSRSSILLSTTCTFLLLIEWDVSRLTSLFGVCWQSSSSNVHSCATWEFAPHRWQVVVAVADGFHFPFVILLIRVLCLCSPCNSVTSREAVSTASATLITLVNVRSALTSNRFWICSFHKLACIVTLHPSCRQNCSTSRYFLLLADFSYKSVIFRLFRVVSDSNDFAMY